MWTHYTRTQHAHARTKARWRRNVAVLHFAHILHRLRRPQGNLHSRPLRPVSLDPAFAHSIGTKPRLLLFPKAEALAVTPRKGAERWRQPQRTAAHSEAAASTDCSPGTAVRANHGRWSGRVIALCGGNYVPAQKAITLCEQPDRQPMLQLPCLPRSRFSTTLRAEPTRTHWPLTILSRPQAPMHGEIGAHRLHFDPKACRSTASEPVGLSVRGGAAQQVTRLFATTRFYAIRLRRSRHCQPDAQKPLRYAFNTTFARTPISPCIAITSAKAE